ASHPARGELERIRALENTVFGGQVAHPGDLDEEERRDDGGDEHRGADAATPAPPRAHRPRYHRGHHVRLRCGGDVGCTAADLLDARLVGTALALVGEHRIRL